MTLIEEGELDRLRQRQIRDYNPSLRTMAQMQDQIYEIFNSPNLDDEGKVKLLQYLQEKFGYLYKKFKDHSLTTPPPAPPPPPMAHPIASPASTPVPSPPDSSPYSTPAADRTRTRSPESVSEALTELRGADPQSTHQPFAMLPLPGGFTPAIAAAPSMNPFQYTSTCKGRSPDPGPAVGESGLGQSYSTIHEPNVSLVGDFNIPFQYHLKLARLKQQLNSRGNPIQINHKNEIVIDGKSIEGSTASDLFRSLYVRNQNMNLRGIQNFSSKLAELDVNQNHISHREAIALVDSYTKRAINPASLRLSTGRASSDIVEKPFHDQKGKGTKRGAREEGYPSNYVKLPAPPVHPPPPGKKPRILHVFHC